MRIKRWESGRKPDQRNHKGRGGSARARQIKKRNQQLKNKLKGAKALFFFAQLLDTFSKPCYLGYINHRDNHKSP